MPALLFGAGAIGFFAVPYTIMVYPILYIVFPRLWSVAHKHGYVTSADFVRGRFGNRWLALAVALTGILATMPYIALQLVGIQVVLGAMGIETSGLGGDLPLIIAFVILAAFTYTSGLRAPAMIAIVKDLLIYITVIAAVIVVPLHLGGYDKVFAPIPAAKLLLAPAAGRIARQLQRLCHARARFGAGTVPVSALDHRHPERIECARGASQRGGPAGLFADARLLALVGFMAIAVGVQSMPEFADGFKRYSNNFSVPALFLAIFPSWFVGVAFAAIAIGALVPAAIMSIATANTFTRNIYREFINPACTDAEESRMAKIVSLVIKAGALVFIFAIPFQYALWLQLLGGVWISQTLPAVILGLYTRMLNGWALLIGWAVRLRPRHLDGGVGELRAGVSAEALRHDGALLHRAGCAGGEHRRGGGAVAYPECGGSDRHKDVTVAGDYA